jgi:hypothetical protein
MPTPESRAKSFVEYCISLWNHLSNMGVNRDSDKIALMCAVTERAYQEGYPTDPTIRREITAHIVELKVAQDVHAIASHYVYEPIPTNLARSIGVNAGIAFNKQESLHSYTGKGLENRVKRAVNHSEYNSLRHKWAYVTEA